MSDGLTGAQQAKFHLLERGVALDASALGWISERHGERPLSLADYASTSGVTLVLDDDVWVNAPTAEHNPNFVFDPEFRLVAGDGGLVLVGRGQSLPTRFVPIPQYYDRKLSTGQPVTDFAHTHSDRVRLSPVQGCAMRCKFCDIPYEFKGRYYPKPTAMLIEAARMALEDPVLPAAHVLISGGTPAPRDYGYLRQTYLDIITALAGVPVDIMMVPNREILNLAELKSAGVHELSLNVEIFDRDIARRLMPEKAAQGQAAYFDFIADAIDALGPRHARSILLVGIEPVENTIAGVEALAKLGCPTVLSPFRPDPITELARHMPPTAELMMDVYLRSRDISAKYGLKLGPRCIPCSHNTMTLADGSNDYTYSTRRAAAA